MVNSIPSRIKVDDTKYWMFSELKENIVGKPVNSDIFALALAYGYNSGVKVPIEHKRDFINMVSASDKLDSLILLIGLTELGEEAIENPSKRYALAEEYANGGIGELFEEFNENEDRFNEVLYQHYADADEQLNGG